MSLLSVELLPVRFRFDLDRIVPRLDPLSLLIELPVPPVLLVDEPLFIEPLLPVDEPLFIEPVLPLVLPVDVPLLSARLPVVLPLSVAPPVVPVFDEP
ncbi:MAG: hypothetical protein M3Z29_10160 [Pseudomonadota bacterium]|nr:hypothetical protein [Pseudomonadota bacterium]